MCWPSMVWYPHVLFPKFEAMDSSYSMARHHEALPPPREPEWNRSETGQSYHSPTRLGFCCSGKDSERGFLPGVSMA